MKTQTNAFISAVHAANREKELRKASSSAELKAIADRHGRFLLGNDREKLREQYKARLIALGGGNDAC